MAVELSEIKNRESETKVRICATPAATFAAGARIGASLVGGEMILLTGGLGAGKTLFTKGILSALEFDADEVTSPSFTLVNLYRAEKFDVYHIDLWRLPENVADAGAAVGLDEIVENAAAVTIIEWAERLRNFPFPEKVLNVKIEGDGDDARTIIVTDGGGSSGARRTSEK